MTSNLAGILGGMGPFASAEFVNTIYLVNLRAFQTEPLLSFTRKRMRSSNA